MADSQATAEDYKAAGNEFMRQRNYTEAAAKYTQAIDLKPECHIYYSNRAIAYSGLKQWEKSLTDASKCVSLDNTFKKGHTLKAKALVQLQRWSDAVKACQNALRQFPEESTFIDLKKMSEVDVNYTNAKVVSFFKYISSKPSNVIIAALQMFMLFNVVIYLVPFTPAMYARWCFKRAIFAWIFRTTFHAGLTHGRPKCNVDYAQALMSDPYVQRIFLGALAAQGRPYAVLVIPIFVHEFVNLFLWLRGLGNTLLPSVTSGIAGMWLRSSLVAVAFFRLCEVFTPYRTFFQTILQWQYLQVRYTMSGYSQETWHKLHVIITSVTTHPHCPSMIDSVYQRLSSMLYNFGNRARQQAEQQAQAAQEAQQ